jgi:hypothetical protein
MSQTLRLESVQDRAQPSGAWAFAVAALTLACAAALLAGWAPILFSIVTVFLFAGPHNWLEARYFLSRMPARWGRLQPFFLVAFAGIAGLTVSFCAMFYYMDRGLLAGDWGEYAYPMWSTLMLVWIATLVELRSRTNPRRDWGWIWPICMLLVAVAWLTPGYFGIGIVYLHPLMAFWLLDRELRRSRPEWRPAFHLCLLTVPVFLVVLWARLWNAPPLPLSSELEQRITDHAGSAILTGLSSHLLVATHTFLEMLHYGVWIIAIPLIGISTAPWRLQSVPMARRSRAWSRGIALFLVASLGIVLVLWGCFWFDYTTTRTVYFAVALFHVLAEVPFLLRAL